MTIKMLTKKKVNESETIITVGPYRIPVKLAAFQEWEAKIMSEAGFTDREIKAEILRRLGYAKN